MATGGLSITRENLYYLGGGKQAAWGTPVVPTWFWRWLNGSDASPDAKIQKEREGDGSPYISLIYKSGQYWTIKVKEKLRPITCGYALQGVLGSGSDTYTAPSKSTTLAALVTAGATTFQSTADLGSVSTLAMNFSPAYSSQVYEVKTVNLVSKTGTGPYTYTLANGATFKYGHPNGDPITSASTHALARALTTYDPYTIEAAYYQAGFGVAMRIQDAVCVEVKLTSEKGKTVEVESTWYATQAPIQAGLLSPTFEGTSVVGAAGGPLVHYQASGQWLLDNSAANNGATIEKFELTLKNSTNPEDLQSEGLTPAYFIPGNFDIDGQITVEFTSYQQYYETYYGSASPAANAVDSYLIGYGQVSTSWIGDAINSVALSLPNVAYTAAKLPPPSLDGKPVKQPIVFSGVKSGATVPFGATLSNSWNNQY